MRFIIAAFALVLAAAATAGAQEEPAADQPVVAAMFYSGFCASCRVLEPRIEAVRDDFEDRPVAFIRFDKTWSALGGADRRQALADAHGMGDIWPQYKDAQGFMLLVDPDAEQVLALITLRHSEEDVRTLIDAALRRAAAA